MGYSAPVETFLWHFFSGMTLYLQFRIESNFINAHLVLICRGKGRMSKFTMKIYAWTRKQTWDSCKKIKSGALPLSFPGQYSQLIMIQGPKATKIKDVYTKI